MHADPVTLSHRRFDKLAKLAQKHISSLPPDDLFSQLDVRPPVRAAKRHPHRSNVIAFAMPVPDAEPQQRAQASLGTVIGILDMQVANGHDEKEVGEDLSEMVSSGWCAPIDHPTRDAIVQVVLGLRAGRYRLTKLSFKELFLDLYGHRIRYCRDDEKVYAYVDGVWVQNKGDYVEAMINELITALRDGHRFFDNAKDAKAFAKWQEMLEGDSVQPSTLRQAKSTGAIWIRKDQFDADPMLLNLQNGVYDLRNDSFLPHDPIQNHTRMAPVAYDPGADCPVFRRMVSDLFGGDREVMDYVQRLLGYCLSGGTSAKRFWVFYGPTANNGKTTLLRVMRSVLGDETEGYYGTMHLETLKAKSTDTKREGLAFLDYKPRLVTIDELAQGCCLSGDLVKALTGNTDGMPARKLFANLSKLEVTFKLVIATNHLPAFDSFDQGIKNRMTVVPFNQTFPLVEGFDSRWRAELPGILNWLIDGYRMYASEGLAVLPAAVAEATDGMVPDTDPLGFFISSFAEEDPSSVMRVGEFKSALNHWATSTGRLHAVVSKDMSGPLQARGYRVDKRCNIGRMGGVPAVWGLRLKSPYASAETPPKEES